MDALLWFVAVLLALTPLVVALVNAVADDMSVPRWGKRLLAVGFGNCVAVVTSYVAGIYIGLAVPLPVVLVCGVGLGINAAGIYDVGKLIGGNVSNLTMFEAEPYRVGVMERVEKLE